jgi:biopolymer transport protein ExbB/TolQ
MEELRMQAVMRTFSQSGECMCIIALVFAVGIAVFAERFVMLLVKYNINAVAFMSQIQKLVAANNIDRAIKLCNAAPTAALSRVIKAGLEHSQGDALEIKGAIDEVAFEVVPLLQKRSRALLCVAAVAACLGIFGAAIGLIRAISSLGHTGPELDPMGLTDLLAASIYPLAFGIAVAIMSLLSYFFLSGVATRIANEINQYSVKLHNMLSARQRSGDGSAPQNVDGVTPQ